MLFRVRAATLAALALGVFLTPYQVVAEGATATGEGAETVTVRPLHTKIAGPETVEQAIALNNEALLLEMRDRLSEAEPLYRRALEIREKVLGPDHPDVATSLSNLAGVYRATGRLTEAEPLFERALQIRQATLGADHPETGNILASLSELYAARRSQNSAPGSVDAIPAAAGNESAAVAEAGPDSSQIKTGSIRKSSDEPGEATERSLPAPALRATVADGVDAKSEDGADLQSAEAATPPRRRYRTCGVYHYRGPDGSCRDARKF